MDNSQNPYFTFDGMYFQTPGDEIETAMNLQIAMERLRAFVVDGGRQDDAAFALSYVQRNHPKVEPFCRDMRYAFLLDDFDDADRKKLLAVRAYNGIVDRLNGKQITWT